MTETHGNYFDINHVNYIYNTALIMAKICGNFTDFNRVIYICNPADLHDCRVHENIKDSIDYMQYFPCEAHVKPM